MYGVAEFALILDAFANQGGDASPQGQSDFFMLLGCNGQVCECRSVVGCTFSSVADPRLLRDLVTHAAARSCLVP